MDEFSKLEKLPPWAWGVAIAGGLGIFLFFRNRSSSSNGGSGSAAAASPGAGSINTATPQCQTYPIPTCDTGQSVVWKLDGQGCPMPVCEITSSGGGSTNQTGVVRNSVTSGCSAAYDSTNTGVPVRSGASASYAIIGEARYGSSVGVTGPAVVGGSNFGSGTIQCPGSLQWYPVSWFGFNGFISAYDFVSVN